MTLFTEITYTSNQKTMLATDELLLRAWQILCQKHVGKLSAEAIRVLLSVSESTMILSSSLVTNQLTDAFELANDAAVIYPEDFQSWESEDKSLCTRDGFYFTLTFHGEVMKEKMLSEINKKHSEFLDELGLIGTNYPLDI